MKESIGYTATLNIIIVFLSIIFTFLVASLIYYKSHKVTNIVINAIEKYEGYNSGSEEEIVKGLSSLGYAKKKLNCASSSGTCGLVENSSNGYCVYLCEEDKYYYYKIRTNMMLNVPIINNILDIPIYSNTNRLYDFQNN